jgi:hypothetical protein
MVMRARIFSLFAVPAATAFTIPASALFVRRFGVDAAATLCSATTTTASLSDAQSFIDSVNTDYEELHRAFEMQFWGTKMALSDPSYSVSELTKTKGEMEGFLADEAKLLRARELLSSVLSSDQDDPTIATTLKMLERTFGCYIMESDEAKTLRSEATQIEGKLESERNNMVLGATMPDGTFEEMSSVGLRSKLRVDPDESVRKACFQGLTKIGDFVTQNGFVELVKVRNKMAKSLGYLDYYDYKVRSSIENVTCRLEQYFHRARNEYDELYRIAVRFFYILHVLTLPIPRLSTKY